MPDTFAAIGAGFGTIQNGLPLHSAHRRPISIVRWTAALAAIDLIGAVLAAMAALHLSAQSPSYDTGKLWTSVGSFILAWLLTSWTQALYAQKLLMAKPWLHSLRGIATCVPAFGFVFFLGVALNWILEISREWLLFWAIGSAVWIGGTRFIWSYCFSASLGGRKCLERALVIAGSRRCARRLADDIESESRGRIAVVDAVAFPGSDDGMPIDRIEEIVRKDSLDRVVIASLENAVAQSRELVTRLMRLAVDVTVIPNIGGLPASVQTVDCIGMLPAICVASRPLTAMEAALKRTEDLLLCCLLLPVLLPFAGLIALAIRLDSAGPVLFGQWREGYQNRPFKVWKFRTMNHAARDETCTVQTSRNDRRVTGVGRILRRLSLDEIPQIINVLRGEMSIVGPRPHALGMTFRGVPLAQALEHYSARHRLKPGITGWAQINNCRGEVDSYEKLHRRVSLDCYYIDHWSVSLDLWILFRTIARLLPDSSAY